MTADIIQLRAAHTLISKLLSFITIPHDENDVKAEIKKKRKYLDLSTKLLTCGV